MGAKDERRVEYPMPTNFGSKEGQTNVEGDDSAHHYSKCAACGKYYGSYVYETKERKICMFCFKHQKNIKENNVNWGKCNIKKGHLVMLKDTPIPAKVKDFLFVRHIEQRASLSGNSYFLYLDDNDDNTWWLSADQVRCIADDDIECNEVEKWINRKQIINPICNMLMKNEGDEINDRRSKESGEGNSN